jgi:hypothetical protein
VIPHRFFIPDLLAVTAMTSIGIAGCAVNAGIACVLVLVTLIFAIATAKSSRVRRQLMYGSITGMIIVAIATQIYSSNTLGGPASPPNTPYFDPLLYPIRFAQWDADDMLRQRIFPLGGCVGGAIGFLIARLFPKSNSVG